MLEGRSTHRLTCMGTHTHTHNTYTHASTSVTVIQVCNDNKWSKHYLSSDLKGTKGDVDAKVINHFTEHLQGIHDNPPSFVITRWLQKHRTSPFPSAFLLDLTSLHATMTKCHIRQYSAGFFFLLSLSLQSLFSLP